MLVVDMEAHVFLKDVKALIKTADDNGYNLQVLKAVENVNALQKKSCFLINFARYMVKNN